MDDAVREAAVEWMQQNVSGHIINLSDDGVKYMIEKHYPTGYTGFHADITAGFKS